SLRQAITPDNLMGRVNATFGFATTSAGLVGALAGGLLGEALGLRAGIALGVVGVGLVSVGLAFSPVRRVRAVQQSEAAAGWSASA
ncbi:MAG: MFS transporter, partial [Chloroflexota bacterium]|nr:MFS transporter [Chloroflexota bacterium]